MILKPLHSIGSVFLLASVSSGVDTADSYVDGSVSSWHVFDTQWRLCQDSGRRFPG